MNRGNETSNEGTRHGLVNWFCVVQNDISAQLKKVVTEIDSETEHDLQGARTIFGWLKSILAEFDTYVRVLSRLSDCDLDELKLQAIGAEVKTAFLLGKYILTEGSTPIDIQKTGWDAGIECQLGRDFSNDTFDGIAPEEFQRRFKLVAKSIRPIIDVIAQMKDEIWELKQ
ncbi:MAG: hypothetical protein JNK57_08505 [Planctomycetaceae bacterium]|nr:hypothetical protein [Planctomycetaceae bacterium]